MDLNMQEGSTEEPGIRSVTMEEGVVSVGAVIVAEAGMADTLMGQEEREIRMHQIAIELVFPRPPRF